MSRLTEDFLRQEYLKKLKSTYQIAKENNTYPNYVRRMLVRFKIKIRDKSEAQSVVYQTKKRLSPMANKKHKDSSKLKISKSLISFWENASEDDRKAVGQFLESVKKLMRKNFIRKNRKKAMKAFKKKVNEPTWLELELKKNLDMFEYNVLVRQNGYDLFLPEEKVAIFIDGISHSNPLFGIDEFIRQKISDFARNEKSLRENNKTIIITNCGTKKRQTKAEDLAFEVHEFIISGKEKFKELEYYCG